MSFPPSVADFKLQFPQARYFLYGADPGTIMDADVQNALNLAFIDFNPDLWDTVTPIGVTTEGGIAMNYLAAHYVDLNVEQAAGGLSSVPRGRSVKNQGGGVIESKAVGSVNVSLAILNLARESPILGPLLETTFGKIYLKLLYPRLVGNIAVVSGQAFSPAVFNTVILPLQITTLSIPGGTHSVAYSQTIHATGGVGQYTWTVHSGTLPPGLTLGPQSGTVAGTPSLAGTYYFQILVTDIMGNTASMNYQVIIA